MAKVKIVYFEIVSLLSESKRIVDFLQKVGKTEIIDTYSDELTKYDTSAIVRQYDNKIQKAAKAISVLQSYCNIKTSFINSFADYQELDYNEYKLLCDKADKISSVCDKIISLEAETEKIKSEISEQQTALSYLSSWLDLDIPMASKRTMSTNIFIGNFNREFSEEDILNEILNIDSELDDVAVEVISKQKMFTCAVIMCHHSHFKKTENVLRQLGFVIPDKCSPLMPSKSSEEIKKRVAELEKDIDNIKSEIRGYISEYDNLRFLHDFYLSQKVKYETVEKTASTETAFVLSGYLPERISEEIKFALEQKFTCQVEFTEPDYENEDVPVLIENGMFGGGVESITDMYSVPSNNDIDPNPIMAFFYYLFFGFMLSDAGYGILMIIFALVAKAKLHVSGNRLKFLNMVFFCGISTVFWGAMFGGWFGDLIPVISTEFLGLEKGPDLAIWMDPIGNSMNLLLYCLGFGIIQLFTGLLIRAFMLFKNKEYFAAVFDTFPIIVFVTGFAILGAGLIVQLPASISEFGVPLLAAGALMIILTGGRSSRSIIGKLGGGLYALYNTTTGYVGDILSYSRLLALSLVTGVVASAVNLLAAMPGNPVIFAVIFVIGHTMNIAINILGTYVHTNRLQYVEFFSKFYEGSGKAFSPFKLNAKYYTIKEEKNYE